MSAETVLEMATINGARALGLQDSIGSLEIGKKADFVVVNPGGLHAAPWDESQVEEGGLDPMTVVVFSCTGKDVECVVVDGEVLVEGGNLVKVDEQEIQLLGELRATAGEVWFDANSFRLVKVK